MARPRKNEHIKDELLEVGLDTLLTKGYHGTGIKEVLDKLGVPKGSFYHYFQSKEVFAAEVIKFYADDLNRRLSSRLKNDNVVGVAAIKSAFSLLVEEYQMGTSGCVLGALASEIAETSESCRLAILKETDNWTNMIAVLVAQGQSAGEIRTDVSSDLLAKMVWNCWEGAILRMKIEASSHAVEEAVGVMFDAILRS